ncbi:MAG TPA: GreA/GreB family elongation factor [Candidatus Dormibacteraeota bacterium]|nr:GreA/GreB family elongation factor [Candidatus Dormibacteraeota bacterium]
MSGELNDTVRIGSRVRMLDQAEGDEEEYTIVAEGETELTFTCISAASPVGRAVLGRAVGERVDVRTPGGLRSVAILGVMAPA